MTMNYFDETEIRKAITNIKLNNDLFEIRIISSTRKTPIVGYFKDTDKMMECLKRQDLRDTNVYIVLNAINEACYSREASDRFVNGATATGDKDVIARDWILVDLDPIRPKGTSSTNEQIKKAHEKCLKVKGFLTEQGFSKPIMAFSGNGLHLLYKIEMTVTDATRNLLQSFLETLDELFTDDEIKIDSVNFNESRVCKLYGTLAQKGTNTEERPHRMSKILEVPEEVKPVDVAYFKKICNLIKHEQIKPNKYNSYSKDNFDIEEWMKKYGLNYRSTSYQDGMKYWLDNCPFDSTHTGKDAAIIRRKDGTIGFHCFHNSCSDKQWRDVRLLFEPDAYTKKWEQEERRTYKTHNREIPKIEPKENQPVFYTIRQILDLPKLPESFIKTGIKEIDKRMRGLKKEYISVWSGLRSSAKSTVLTGIALNAINDDNTVVMYSGELAERRAARWLLQQAAGKTHVEPSKFEGCWNVPKKYQDMIAEWMGKKLRLYNNYYGHNFVAIQQELIKVLEETKADLVILDNLMSFDIHNLSDDKWEAQKNFVWTLHEMAIKYQVHIAFVAHPKKAAGFLRFDDISGTADIGNMVDDAFIVHRNNDDFKRLFKQMYGNARNSVLDSGTNIIEIVKDRDNGTQDVFVPLFYEPESKRLKNEVAENINYGWAENLQDDFVPATDEDNIFQ